MQSATDVVSYKRSRVIVLESFVVAETARPCCSQDIRFPRLLGDLELVPSVVPSLEDATPQAPLVFHIPERPGHCNYYIDNYIVGMIKQSILSFKPIRAYIDQQPMQPGL